MFPYQAVVLKNVLFRQVISTSIQLLVDFEETFVLIFVAIKSSSYPENKSWLWRK